MAVFLCLLAFLVFMLIIFSCKFNTLRETTKNYNEHVKKRLHNIGNIESKCPYCGIDLQCFPTRKTKCRNCYNDIYVIKRPYDSKIVLTTEKDKKILDIDRTNLKYYFCQADFFEYEKELKIIRKNGFVPPCDVYWYKLQCKALVAFSNKNYQELKMIYYARGEEMFRRTKYGEALNHFLQACYIDACGATSSGFLYTNKNDIIRKPELSFLFVGYIGKCITNLKLSENELVDFFMEADFENLPYPIERSFFIPTIRKNYKSTI